MGSEKLSSVCYILSDESIVVFPFTLRVTGETRENAIVENKEERYSRVRRYSAKGTKGECRYANSKAKC